ncbi:MAG: hypothetical protein MI924_05125 [Chloroflexales bacterium]|nr:hypothetical protein [Chloroflexales bacterium]
MEHNYPEQPIIYSRSLRGSVIYFPVTKTNRMRASKAAGAHTWTLFGAIGVLLVAGLTIGALTMLVVHLLLMVQTMLQMAG